MEMEKDCARTGWMENTGDDDGDGDVDGNGEGCRAGDGNGL